MSKRWTIEDCDTCAYMAESHYRNGAGAGFELGLAGDHVAHRALVQGHAYPRPAVLGCGLAETTADLAVLRKYRDDLRQALENVLDVFDPMIFGPVDWPEDSKQAVAIKEGWKVLGHDAE